MTFATVEAEIGILEEDGKGVAAQAGELLMAAFGLAPEALDAADVVAPFAEDGLVGVGVLSIL